MPCSSSASSPGGGSPPHSHGREHEVSYVLEGEIGLRIGEKELIARKGSCVVRRPQVTHAFWNATGSPVRVLEVISPAGFERYFRELAEIHAVPLLPGRETADWAPPVPARANRLMHAWKITGGTRGFRSATGRPCCATSPSADR
jgi:hypothetical protein